jgi:DtxR family Mn-dependent transcriptional regulator
MVVGMEAATSESEEMYLIHIAMAGEEGVQGPVGLSRLAEMLSVSPISVNQMVKKLVGRGLVEYLPYKGVELTGAGREVADQVLRRRRLWALFLADQLGLSPARADAIACDLEHITPPDLADRLADLLGDPASGPQGRRIPRSGRPAPPPTRHLLSELPVGGQATVIAVEASNAGRSFLAQEGVAPGATVTVVARAADGDCLIQVGDADVHVAGRLAASIAVSLL